MEPKLKTLFDLLMEGYSAAQLAAAVETHGIVGWDRFGRFSSYKTGSTVAAQALDAIAGFHDEELRFWEEVECNPPENQDEMSQRSFPLDVVADLPSNGLHRFGWLVDQVPEIDRLDLQPQPPSYVEHAARVENLLVIMGALLDYLANRPRPVSQSQVLGSISIANPKVRGLGESTLEKWFAQANKAFKDAKSKVSP
jgi:hypothetical protein